MRYTCAILPVYGYLRPVRLYNIFPLYFIHAWFATTAIEHKMCDLIFSTNFFLIIFRSKRTWARYDHNCKLVFTWSAHYNCQISMILEFSRRIFGKHSNIIPFHSHWGKDFSLKYHVQTPRSPSLWRRATQNIHVCTILANEPAVFVALVDHLTWSSRRLLWNLSTNLP
jgi:hypothetical protein